MNKNKTNKNAEGSLLTQPTGSDFWSGDVVIPVPTAKLSKAQKDSLRD